MSKASYRNADQYLKKRHRPESIVSTYGYAPALSEGALVPPIFLSSTFIFSSAEEGERSFQVAYHLKKFKKRREPSLIYTRLNNPNLEILEDRLTLFEKGTERAAVFSSGMAAITTAILSLTRSGESVLYSAPVYGGTDYLFVHILPRLGIRTVPFPAGTSGTEVSKLLQKEEAAGHRPRMVFLETPANPTCTLTDIEEVSRAVHAFAKKVRRPVDVAVDNTFLGPMWQSPAELGADLVVYSATKFLGGHSDVVAGAVLGRREMIEDVVKVYRTILGTVLGPFEGYLLLRSLDTLKMRMTAQSINAGHVVDWLERHPKVAQVNFPGLVPAQDPQRRIFERQCRGPGSMVSFYLKGGKREAFRFLNALRLAKLAVSLGGTKTLAEHPATMTHSDLDPKERVALGIDDRMIRLSVGAEHYKDIIQDLEQALRTP